MFDKVMDMFKGKITAGVYEPSDVMYCFCWFCVPKKNGSLRLVHNLLPLNAMTICNTAVPLFVDQFAEGIAVCSCYSMPNLLVSYGIGPSMLPLVISHCDLTSFQSPLRALCNMTLLQGSMNAVAIFHGDVTFILKPKIPNITKPFLDDTVVKGLPSHYETPDGGYETVPNNTDICHFIWEHLNDVHQVMH